MNKTVVSKDGTKIVYEKVGHGPLVVLVGGAMNTKSDRLFKPLSSLLEKNVTVVSYDRRGRGDSSNTPPYSVEREIEDLQTVIADAGGSACVFGMSSGGNLVLLAATTIKSIEAIAVYEPPYIREEHFGDANKFLADLKQLIANGKYGKVVKLFLKKVGVPTPVIAVMSLTPMWSGMKVLAPTIIYDMTILGDGTVPSHLGSINVPTFVVTGSAESMQKAARDVIAIVPDSKHLVLAGQSHNVRPEILASALLTIFKAIY